MSNASQTLQNKLYFSLDYVYIVHSYLIDKIGNASQMAHK
ncbi:hypothetical protein BN890_43470 [Bacteroides xylanisolvens SD CC 1b]|uniref:Uncharacterized protein n=1 Tax=Bacteroides xylanisolvens SD CC 1b TaxID=702447 RepID=D4VJD7_9BACE|nr:hypothetical protein CW3_3207 [Bacteroides xylanisolvens SD CC 1b]EXY41834.1 hypothetical protein M117_1157 [Bacteroides fragilis str. 3774 T13]CDM06729.1 hypothetical protein BN890_43470 [Bacteroides xylanisolvens SD CC 1b]